MNSSTLTNEIDESIPDIHHQCLIIGKEELINKNLGHKLHHSKIANYNIHISHDLKEGLDFLTTNEIEFLVLDIDHVELEEIYRVQNIVNHFQLPTMVIGSDPAVLNHIKSQVDTSFMGFLAKGILNRMFHETHEVLMHKNSTASKISKRLKSVGQHSKPKFLVFLASLLFLEPVIKIIYLKIQTGFEWETLIRTILSIEGFGNNFEFWVLFPLAGYALLSIKAWSFFFFMGLQVYTLLSYFTYEKFTWPYVSETPHLSSSLLLSINMLLVGYFMVPAYRRPYWNISQKLWRNTSRFATKLKTKFKANGNDISTTITNISASGAYFTTNMQLPVGQVLELEIPLFDRMEKIEAVIRRKQDLHDDQYYGYGVEFKYHSKEQQQNMKFYVNSLVHRIQ